MADPRLKPVKSKRTLGEYAARVQWCEACGVPADAEGRIWDATLELHHIIKRGRSDERTNLIRLCRICHCRAEATSAPKFWLTLGVILSIKKLRDPTGWDAKRLAELRLKNLPDLLPIPQALLDEFSKWRPANNEGDMPW